MIGWESLPDEGYTRMEVVGWNRHNLLAIITGALTSRNLNVLSADIFMREDDLVLDIFRVCTTNFRPIKNQREQERIEQVIFEACGGKGARGKIDLAKLIEERSAPSVLDRPKYHYTMPQRVWVSNRQSDTATVLEIQAADRIGLLFDVFNVLSELDTEVLSARISTQAGAAIDRFYLVDTITEKKITDPKKLEAIKSRVWEQVAIAQEEPDPVSGSTNGNGEGNGGGYTSRGALPGRSAS